MAKQYNNTGSPSDNIGLTTNGHADESGLISGLTGGLGTALFGDEDSFGQFVNELTGYNSQQREFSQQEYLLDKQNKWNSAAEQMKRAKEAGINPLTAAGSIAGSAGAASVPQVSSATTSAAGGLSALGTAVGSIGSLGAQNDLANAEAENQRSQANKNNAELPFVPVLSHGQYMQMYGNFIQSMKDVGIAEVISGGIAFDLMSGGLQKAIDYLSLCSGIRNVDTQMKNIKADYDLKMKDVESYDLRLNSNLSLQEKQGLQAAANALKLKAETEYQNQINSLNASLPGITLGQSSFITALAWKKGVDSPEFHALENGIYRWTYNSSFGNYKAEAENAYSIAYARKSGENVSDVTYGRIGSAFDMCGRIAGIGTNFLTGLGADLIQSFKYAANDIKNAFARGDAKKVRQELRMVLDNLYDQMDKYPEDAEHCQKLIDDIQTALQLNNKELLDWYKKQND